MNRDSKGRFVKATKVSPQRDARGRFVGKAAVATKPVRRWANQYGYGVK